MRYPHFDEIVWKEERDPTKAANAIIIEKKGVEINLIRIVGDFKTDLHIFQFLNCKISDLILQIQKIGAIETDIDWLVSTQAV